MCKQGAKVLLSSHCTHVHVAPFNLLSWNSAGIGIDFYNSSMVTILSGNVQKWGPDVLHWTHIIISSSPSPTICPLWSSIWHLINEEPSLKKNKKTRETHEIRSARSFLRGPDIQSFTWLQLDCISHHSSNRGIMQWHSGNRSIKGRAKTAGHWQLAFTRSNRVVAGGLINGCYCTNVHAGTPLVKCSDRHEYLLLYQRWVVLNEV